MKKMELSQMENLQGGTEGCGVVEGLAYGLGGTGVIFAAAVATGPIGWIGLGLAASAYGLSIAAGLEQGSDCLK